MTLEKKNSFEQLDTLSLSDFNNFSALEEFAKKHVLDVKESEEKDFSLKYEKIERSIDVKRLATKNISELNNNYYNNKEKTEALMLALFMFSLKLLESETPPTEMPNLANLDLSLVESKPVIQKYLVHLKTFAGLNISQGSIGEEMQKNIKLINEFYKKMREKMQPTKAKDSKGTGAIVGGLSGGFIAASMADEKSNKNLNTAVGTAIGLGIGGLVEKTIKDGVKIKASDFSSMENFGKGIGKVTTDTGEIAMQGIKKTGTAVLDAGKYMGKGALNIHNKLAKGIEDSPIGKTFGTAGSHALAGLIEAGTLFLGYKTAKSVGGYALTKGSKVVRKGVEVIKNNKVKTTLGAATLLGGAAVANAYAKSSNDNNKTVKTDNKTKEETQTTNQQETAKENNDVKKVSSAKETPKVQLAKSNTTNDRIEIDHVAVLGNRTMNTPTKNTNVSSKLEPTEMKLNNFITTLETKSGTELANIMGSFSKNPKLLEKAIENLSAEETMKVLMLVISVWEGGFSRKGKYNAVRSKYKSKLGNKKLTTMTIGEILDMELGDCGAYQIIPSTLKWLIKYSYLSRNTIYSEKTQDEAAKLLLLKKRSKIRGYFMGKNSLQEAMHSLANEWRSTPKDDGTYINPKLNKLLKNQNRDKIVKILLKAIKRKGEQENNKAKLYSV